MALNKANDDLMLKRRERVARFRLQGLTIREIAIALADEKDPIVDPDTKKPYSHVTIASDLEALKAEWIANAATSTDEQIAKQEAEIEELKKWAWSKNRGDLVLRCMERLAKLKGLDKPTNVNVNINRKELEAMSDDELAAIAAGKRPD